MLPTGIETSPSPINYLPCNLRGCTGGKRGRAERNEGSEEGNARPRPAMHPLQINLPPPFAVPLVGGEMTSLLRTFATSCYRALHPCSPTPSLRFWFYPRFLLASTCPNPNISAFPYFKDERVDLWLGRSRALPTAVDTNCSVFRWFFQSGKPGCPVFLPRRTNKYRGLAQRERCCCILSKEK